MQFKRVIEKLGVLLEEGNVKLREREEEERV